MSETLGQLLERLHYGMISFDQLASWYYERGIEQETMKSEIARLTDEVEEARRWVNDLQSGMYINCVYCGHRYGPKDKVPCTMADALKQHIEQCPKHPMSSLRAELADLKDGLTAAHMDGFASGKAEAKEMLRKRDGQLEELRAKLEQAEKELAAEREKSKCNHEWKEWTSTAGRTRQCIKCGQQYSWFG